jgi:chromosome partitioning protein
MAKIITIGNHKGGVGKTTTVVNLAHGLTLRGKTVLLVDLDPQGQLASVLDIEKTDSIFELLALDRSRYDQLMVKTGRSKLWLIPGSMKTANAAKVLQDEPITFLADKLNEADHDYIIIDTAPSVGDLQRQAIRAADHILIPCASDYLSTEGVFRFLSIAEKVDNSASLAGVLPTMYDEQTKESKAVLEELHTKFNNAVLQPIHRATILRECAAEGKTIYELAPTSRAAAEYSALVDHVLGLA